MITIKYISKVLSNFKKNFHFLGKFNLQEDFTKNFLSYDSLRQILMQFYFEANKEEAKKYAKELRYLQSKKNIEMLPYEQIKKLDYPIQGDYDKNKQLPYVLHNGKKLYFPAHWKLSDAINTYRYFIERENLLGGNFTEEAPHQYQSDSFKIESGDILLDIGSAEGLVALDTIEKVKKVYLYEAEPMWKAPLEATFAPYRDKVVIINKWVSDKDDNISTTLLSSISEKEPETFFVKMDIEGAEEIVIKGNEEFFKKNRTKIACCTYHKAEHFENISSMLKNWNFTISTSSGYMLCFMDNVFKPPYFRKGLIRASNIK